MLSASADPVTDLHFTLAAVPENAGASRYYIREFLERLNCEEDLIMDVLTATGEAVINVIEHAYARANGDLSVQARCIGGELIFMIVDRGHWQEPRDPLNDERGRGIPIMRKLATSCRIRPTLGGTSVALAFPLTSVTSNLLQQDPPTSLLKETLMKEAAKKKKQPKDPKEPKGAPGGLIAGATGLRNQVNKKKKGGKK